MSILFQSGTVQLLGGLRYRDKMKFDTFCDQRFLQV